MRRARGQQGSSLEARQRGSGRFGRDESGAPRALPSNCCSAKKNDELAATLTHADELDPHTLRHLFDVTADASWRGVA